MNSTKVSFSLDNELLSEITKLTKKVPRQNQTQILNEVIHKGLTLEKEIEHLKKREEHILLKQLYMMRVLIASRSEQFLDEIDQKFNNDLEEMREMILNEGMDYVI